MLTLLVTISCHCWNYNLNNCNSGKSVVSFRTMHLRRWQQRRKSLMRCHWPLRKEWGSSGKEWSKNIENWSRKIFTFEINFWSFYRTMPLTLLYELFALSLFFYWYFFFEFNTAFYTAVSKRHIFENLNWKWEMNALKKTKNLIFWEQS